LVFFGFFIAELERLCDNGDVQFILEKSAMHAQEHILFEQILSYQFKKGGQK